MAYEIRYGESLVPYRRRPSSSYGWMLCLMWKDLHKGAWLKKHVARRKIMDALEGNKHYEAEVFEVNNSKSGMSVFNGKHHVSTATEITGIRSAIWVEIKPSVERHFQFYLDDELWWDDECEAKLRIVQQDTLHRITRLVNKHHFAKYFPTLQE